MTRASTMLLALLILNVLLGTLCVIVARSERKSAALRLWGWGTLLYSLGILITIAAFLPFDLRKVTGNMLIAYAPILSVGGALSITNFRLNLKWTHIAWIASVLPIVINHLRPHPIVLVDILAPAPIANVLFILATVVLLRDPPPDAKNAARFLAGTFAFAVLVWTLRMISIWRSIGGTNDRERADLTIALFGIAQIVIAVAATLALLWVDVRKMEAALRRFAESDALTGLPNRRAMIARFRDEADRAARYQRRFAIVVLDIDHFKRINDTQGHLAGDEVLKRVADVLHAAARAGDAVARIGGEEFVFLFAEQSADKAIAAANRLREQVEIGVSITISGGIASYPEDGTTWERLFAAADRRLYEAKSGGRNRIVGPEEPQQQLHTA